MQDFLFYQCPASNLCRIFYFIDFLQVIHAGFLRQGGGVCELQLLRIVRFRVLCSLQSSLCRPSYCDITYWSATAGVGGEVSWRRARWAGETFSTDAYMYLVVPEAS